MTVLTDAQMRRGIDVLVRREAVFAEIVSQFGTPPLWKRPTGLATLVHVVVEQKISIDSAQAVMTRLDRRCRATDGSFSAGSLRLLTLEQLMATGLSGAKARYCHAIADACLSGTLDLNALAALPDDEVMAQLTAVKGIGPWTAGVYLMVALARVDGWASGDRALVMSLAELERLDNVPTYAALDARAQAWRPWRGVAARLLWHAYLERRGRTMPDH